MLVASEVPMPVGYSIGFPFFIFITPVTLDEGPVASWLLRERARRLTFWRSGARRLTEPGADLLAMLAESWRWQRVARGRSRERDWMANHRHGLLSTADLDNGIEANLAGKGNPSCDVVDRATGDAGGAQSAEPLAGCPCAQTFNQERAQGLAVARAVLRFGEPGIVREFRKAEDLTEFAELPVVPGGNN